MISIPFSFYHSTTTVTVVYAPTRTTTAGCSGACVVRGRIIKVRNNALGFEKMGGS